MDAPALRAEFPVLDRFAYLNAGTDGPVPRSAAEAARAEIDRQESEGRFRAHFERRMELLGALRERYATLLGCDVGDIALTTSTTEGLGTVIAGLALGPGDEIVTSDQEHPGLLGPLQAARDLHGTAVRVAPFAQLAEAVAPATTLVATSHVSWVGGEVAPAALAELDVPVVLDGAQGAGAVPVDVAALGAAAYAAAGQKWLCGPDGAGLLYVSPELRERLAATRRGYVSFTDAGQGLDAPLHPDARRYDAQSLPAEGNAFALAAYEVLAVAGWDAVHERGVALAEELAGRLLEAGFEVAPRGRSTLVSWRTADGEADRARALEAGVVIRDIPGRGLLRASVGAWNDESDLDRLLGALRPAA